MKQYRITTADLTYDSPDDCYLAPDDPIQELKINAHMAGLGADVRLHEHRAATSSFSDTRGTEQREKRIKPGTEEWFIHWFGRKP
jgi:hypothetical protein